MQFFYIMSKDNIRFNKSTTSGNAFIGMLFGFQSPAKTFTNALCRGIGKDADKFISRTTF